MAQIGGTIGSGRLDEFAPVKEAAKEVGIAPTTLKRWLKENKVPGVTWGTDTRGWIYVKMDSIQKLKDYRNRVHIAA